MVAVILAWLSFTIAVTDWQVDVISRRVATAAVAAAAVAVVAARHPMTRDGPSTHLQSSNLAPLAWLNI